MGDVLPLKAHGIDAQKVVEALVADKETFDEIYVCGVTRDGEMVAYISGDMGGLGLTAIRFQDLAIQYLRGHIK
jgi:hypothetical protein